MDQPIQLNIFKRRFPYREDNLIAGTIRYLWDTVYRASRHITAWVLVTGRSRLKYRFLRLVIFWDTAMMAWLDLHMTFKYFTHILSQIIPAYSLRKSLDTLHLSIWCSRVRGWAYLGVFEVFWDLRTKILHLFGLGTTMRNLHGPRLTQELPS